MFTLKEKSAHLGVKQIVTVEILTDVQLISV